MTDLICIPGPTLLFMIVCIVIGITSFLHGLRVGRQSDHWGRAAIYIVVGVILFLIGAVVLVLAMVTTWHGVIHCERCTTGG